MSVIFAEREKYWGTEGEATTRVVLHVFRVKCIIVFDVICFSKIDIWVFI